MPRGPSGRREQRGRESERERERETKERQSGRAKGERETREKGERETRERVRSPPNAVVILRSGERRKVKREGKRDSNECELRKSPFSRKTSMLTCAFNILHQ